MSTSRPQWEPCTGHQCVCGDEDRPGWPCSECGTVAVLYMTDEEFASLDDLDGATGEGNEE